ncbi:MAG: TSUP family transporter [Gemmatimonadales bacterium]
MATLLRSLLAVGMGLVLVGAALSWIRAGRLPHGTVSADSLLALSLRLDGGALATLGVLVLLATPPLSLVWLGSSFARGRDWRFAAISTGLVVLVALGLVAAGVGESGSAVPSATPAGLWKEIGVFFAAAGAGALGVQVGLGGGAFLVPLLSGFLAVPMKLAIAAGAVSVVVNSVVGTSTYMRDRIPNVRLALLLELPTLMGAIVGGLLVAIVAADVLRGIFAAVLLGLALRTFTRRQTPHVASGGDDPFGVAGSYHDAATGEDVSYQPQRLSLGAGAGLFGGTLSGLLGLAGGVVTMPVMLTVMRMPVKAAAATSVLMGGFTVSASAYIYYVHGLIDLSIVIPAVIGIQMGSRTGARLSRRLRGVVLERVLAVVLTGLGVVLVLQLLGIGPPAS